MSTHKKKLILVCIAVALVAVLSLGATLAYLSDMQSVLNILGIGSDDFDKDMWIEIIEEEYDKIADQDKFLGNLLPGDVVYKDPVVKNHGIPCYVRVKVYQDAAGTIEYPASNWANPFRIWINSQEMIDGEMAGWEFNAPDGYIYYTNGRGQPKVLEKDKVTPMIFIEKTFQGNDGQPILNEDGTVKDGTLQIPVGWGNEKVGENYYLYIQAEAVQAANFGVNLSDPGGKPWGDILIKPYVTEPK